MECLSACSSRKSNMYLMASGSALPRWAVLKMVSNSSNGPAGKQSNNPGSVTASLCPLSSCRITNRNPRLSGSGMARSSNDGASTEQPCQIDLRDHLAASVALPLVRVVVVLHQMPQFSAALQGLPLYTASSSFSLTCVMVSQFRHLTVTSWAVSFSGFTQCSVWQGDR
ncbi:hypothetical protein EYF80_030435 [Liparis tanakae]|uniref:Uncharacterized protein n=1 Tax=Liparis tanakae TaxID=230148 RepID=A0A4Z2H396_9TELE|nr:hypothetical protein EYF80_030435 [Liparis tanakae]